MPKTFWVDAVNIAVYLNNRGSSVTLQFKLPEEVWIGKELKYYHLRTFSCIAYVRIDPEKNDKLDAEAVKCYFIGYGPYMFEYRFWDAKNRNVLRHCDVTLHEMSCIRTKRRKVLRQRSK